MHELQHVPRGDGTYPRRREEEHEEAAKQRTEFDRMLADAHAGRWRCAAAPACDGGAGAEGMKAAIR
jgi:hypothetical protein